MCSPNNYFTHLVWSSSSQTTRLAASLRFGGEFMLRRFYLPTPLISSSSGHKDFLCSQVSPPFYRQPRTSPTVCRHGTTLPIPKHTDVHASGNGDCRLIIPSYQGTGKRGDRTYTPDLTRCRGAGNPHTQSKSTQSVKRRSSRDMHSSISYCTFRNNFPFPHRDAYVDAKPSCAPSLKEHI